MASSINLVARSRLVGIVRMSGAFASTLVFTNALVPRGVITATASPPDIPANRHDSVDAGLGATPLPARCPLNIWLTRQVG